MGELAVLAGEERVVTVTALTDVQAFRLRKVDFDEALRTRPEIAAGVIAELVRRLRTRPPLPWDPRPLLAAHAGLLGLSVVLLIVPASALFLDHYGTETCRSSILGSCRSPGSSCRERSVPSRPWLPLVAVAARGVSASSWCF